MNLRKILCAALSALFLWIPVPAAWGAGSPETAEETGSVEDWFEEKGLALGESSIAYPSLREGRAEESVRAAVNDRILEDGGIRDYAARLSLLVSGGKLRVTWTGNVFGPVFSFAVAAEGAVAGPRPDYVWTGGNVDLRDGQEVGLEAIFTDPAEARERMAAYLEETLAPELSPHLRNSEVTPLPERFRIQERGLVWMYPSDRLSTLSDRAGELLVPWQVVRDLLDVREGGIVSQLGLEDWMGLETPASAEEREREAVRIRDAAARGEFPGIPARLGEPLQPLTDRYRLLTDPDVYISGRLFALEGAGFQQAWLLTDYLSETWENSRVDGIRADAGSFFCLSVGETVREDWLTLLGEPDHSIVLEEEQAEAHRTVAGIRDYYICGENRLQLQSDGQGVLACVILAE